MSVYTPIHLQQLQHFLNLYSLGRVLHYSGIQAGIENTNYRVTSSQGDFIVTIFESLSSEELSSYLVLLNHLNKSDFPSPKPYICSENNFINSLADKPAAVFNCLPGHSIERPSIDQCTEIGQYLAQLHMTSQSSGFDKYNLKNIIGCQQVFNKIKENLSGRDVELLTSELDFQLNYSVPDLPRGVIHADLFKDNVLFNKGSISAILDFYNACNDCFLFDIAITCNDWCIDNGAINQQKFKALLSGYQSIRILNDDEQKHLTFYLRLAALRFYLSRLEHQLNPKEGELVLKKDPLIFRSLLEYYRANSSD